MSFDLPAVPVTADIRRQAAAVLFRAHGLLKKGWTQKVFARDDKGMPCGSLEPTAMCWCLLGALSGASEGLSSDIYTYARLAVQEAAGDRRLLAWNDAPGRTAEEVVEVVWKAYCKEEEHLDAKQASS